MKTVTTSTPAAVTPSNLLEAARTLAQTAPFRGPKAPEGCELATLTGKLPEWLRGDLVRLTIDLGATPDWAPAHWFDGVGLAYGLTLAGGNAVRLRWAVLDCAVGRAARRGQVPYAQFSSPNQRSGLRRLFGPIPNLTDNANVNVVRMGPDWVAMTETPHQLLLDDDSLRVRGHVRYADQLRHASPLAHPIVSGDTVTNLVSKLGPRAEVSVCRHQAASRRRDVLARWTTFAYPYIHSFGLTPETAIIIDHPLRLHPLDLVWSNRGVIEHFKWQQGSATRLVLLSLRDGSVRTYETEPLFCFHTVHAFETSEHTVLDLLAYDDAAIVRGLSLPGFAAGFPDCKPELLRLLIDRRSGKVSRQVLSDTRFEFPQLDYERVGAGETDHVFGSALHSRDARLRSEIVRIAARDTHPAHTGAEPERRFSEGTYVFGEPVFVGDPARARAGQGVLLAVGADERGSALFVLDASSLDVLAHARFETPLPLGFHGSFLRVSPTR